jgi:hypothetical protein
MNRTLGCLALSCAVALVGLIGSWPAGAAAADNPIFVFTPNQPTSPATPPPSGHLEGPCGLAVSSNRLYVSDYYHDAIDTFFLADIPTGVTDEGSPGYEGQLSGVDPLDGPCGLALDSANHLYVNDYHRAVLASGTAITGAGVDDAHPTGVALDAATGTVYVDDGTYIAVYDSSGAPVTDGLIGFDPGADYYGLAFANGRVYVADASDQTVKAFEPALDKANPVLTIDAAGTPRGSFVSLRDAALAVDRVSGEVYVADDTQPAYTEEPQATIQVFAADGTYKGHLKYNVVDAQPPGLAVENSTGAFQGRVYVTSGNTSLATIYAYPPGAANTGTALPPLNTFGAAGGLGATAGLVPGPLIGSSTLARSAATTTSGQTSPRSSQRHRRRAHRHHRAYRHRRRAPHGGGPR